ncbi:MAG: hypothetical protein O7H39_09640 [Gammaproteobacteria bacterium]|nr:hypothetical protein [Gammaproteobacteria bacterium]
MGSIFSITPTRLGDTLFCTPAYRHIKQCFPEQSLEVVALTQRAADVVRNNPDIDLVHLVDAPADLASVVPRVKRVVHLHHLALAEPFIEILSGGGAPVDRVGPQDNSMHSAQQSVSFVAGRYGGEPDGQGYSLVPTPADIERAVTLLPGPHPYVGLHLGCHGIGKRSSRFWRNNAHRKAWPLNRFVQAASVLREALPDVQFVLTGGGEEARLAKSFERQVRHTVNLIDQTTVAEMAAIMARLALLICNDTGPLHVACTTAVPIVALYGPTEVHRTHPYPEAAWRRVIVEPNLKRLDADRVVAEALIALGMNKGGAGG